jgi:hypothetical protein
LYFLSNLRKQYKKVKEEYLHELGEVEKLRRDPKYTKIKELEI